MPTLNYQEITLLKHILTTTGETEMSADGKESLAPRKLKDEVEVSQRRHFVKNTKEITDSLETKVRDLANAHNKLVEDLREEYKKENPPEDLPEDATPEEKK